MESRGVRGQRGKKREKPKQLFNIVKKGESKIAEESLFRSLRLSNFNQLQSTMSILKASCLAGFVFGF